MENDVQKKVGRVLLALVAVVVLSVAGCSQTKSTEELLKDSIAQKNSLADLISGEASADDVADARSRLDELQVQLDSRQSNMSKVKWNKLWAKYRELDRVATERIAGESSGDVPAVDGSAGTSGGPDAEQN